MHAWRVRSHCAPVRLIWLRHIVCLIDGLLSSQNFQAVGLRTVRSLAQSFSSGDASAGAAQLALLPAVNLSHHAAIKATGSSGWYWAGRSLGRRAWVLWQKQPASANGLKAWASAWIRAVSCARMAIAPTASACLPLDPSTGTPHIHVFSLDKDGTYDNAVDAAYPVDLKLYSQAIYLVCLIIENMLVYVVYLGVRPRSIFT